jgi:hypothetical protein
VGSCEEGEEEESYEEEMATQEDSEDPSTSFKEFMDSTTPNSLCIETILSFPYNMWYNVGGKYVGSLVVVRRRNPTTPDGQVIPMLPAMEVQTKLCWSSPTIPSREFFRQEWLVMQQINDETILDILNALPDDTELIKFARHQELIALLNKKSTAAEQSQIQFKKRKSNGTIKRFNAISLKKGCGTIHEDRRNFRFEKNQTMIAFLVRFNGSSGKGKFSLQMTPTGSTQSYYSVGFNSLSKMFKRVIEGRNKGMVSDSKRKKVLKKLKDLQDLLENAQTIYDMATCRGLIQDVIADLEVVGEAK